MKAFVLPRYGSPDVLELREIPRPEPGPDEVLVRVRATNVQPADWHMMRGEPYVARLIPGPLGLRAPKVAVLGADVAGVVERTGRDVTGFAPGDEVYAMTRSGGFAEYVCVPADELVPKPGNLTFEQAAAVPLAALTALLGLRGVRPGLRVLVNGASGGVGTFAVQLAKAYDAEVTAVCGTRNVALLRSLGADDVLDYTKEDFTRGDRRYDLVLDCAGGKSGAALRRVMTRTGVYAAVGAKGTRWFQPVVRMLTILAANPLVPQKMTMVDVINAPDAKRNLRTVSGLIEEGRVTPVIDRVHSFAEIPEALRYQEEGHATGKVVVTVRAG